MATPECIAGVLAYLHQCYPSRPIDEGTAAAWEITFSDVGDANLQAAARAAANEPDREFMPTPGNIRTHLTSGRRDPPLVLANPDDAITRWYAERAKSSKRVQRPADG